MEYADNMGLPRPNLQTEIDRLKAFITRELLWHKYCFEDNKEYYKDKSPVIPKLESKIDRLEDVVEAAITAMRKRCERGHDHLCNSHVSIKHPCNCGHELLWEAIADCENLAKLEGRAERTASNVRAGTLDSSASPQPCKKCGAIGGGGKVYQEPCMALDSTPVIDCPKCGGEEQ